MGSTDKLSDLPQLHKFITGHNDEGKAVVHSHQDLEWRRYDNDRMAFSVVYTTSETPPDLNADKDVKAHEALMQTGRLGLVNPHGSVIRYVDFEPGYRCGMHRTQSLDYGIVMEGSIQMVLDSGETHDLKKGDVAVQRATQHQWVNTSETKWARMLFVLQDCAPLYVAGKEYGEDLGVHSELPPSRE
jgi:quercetin dioxygenase-like cupin family protein